MPPAAGKPRPPGPPTAKANGSNTKAGGGVTQQPPPPGGLSFALPDAASMFHIATSPAPPPNGLRGEGTEAGADAPPSNGDITGDNGTGGDGSSLRGATPTWAGVMLPAGGIYLLPAVYRPTVRFLAQVTATLPSAGVSSTSLAAPDGGLWSHLEAAVDGAYLPQLRLDMRARIIAALSQPNAFRPRARARAPYTADPSRGRPVVAAVLSAESLVRDLAAAAASLPHCAEELLLLAASLVLRTLEGARQIFGSVTGRSASAALAAQPGVDALLMSEPAFVALAAADAAAGAGAVGTAVASGASDDATDGRLDSALAAMEALAAAESERKLFALLAASRPIAEAALLTDPIRLAALAAMADSTTYLAGVMDALAVPGAPWGEELASPVAELSSKARALGGRCLRVLRIEALLQAMYHLQRFRDSSYVVAEDATEPAPWVQGLIRSAARAEEDVAPYCPPGTRVYLFGSLGSLASWSLMAELRNMGDINVNGARRVMQHCAALAQGLAASGAGRDGFNAGAERALQRARAYYGLLALDADPLVTYATANPGLYTASEYDALCAVHVPGRDVTDELRAKLAKALGVEGDAAGRVFSLNAIADSMYTQGAALQANLITFGNDLKESFAALDPRRIVDKLKRANAARRAAGADRSPATPSPRSTPAEEGGPLSRPAPPAAIAASPPLAVQQAPTRPVVVTKASARAAPPSKRPPPEEDDLT